MEVRKLLAGLLASAMIVSSLGANTTAFASEITPKETVEESSETEVVEETEEDKNENDSSKLSDGKDTSKTEAVDDKEEVSEDEEQLEESADSSEEVEESKDDKKDDASLSDGKDSKDADTKDESALEEDAEEEDEEASDEDEEADEEEIIMESAEMEFKDASMDYFVVVDGVLKLKAGVKMSSLPSTVWIPTDVVTIDKGIFDGNTYVTRVRFDKSAVAPSVSSTSKLTTIKEGAFSGSAIQSIELPQELAITIESSAFSDSDLETIDLGDKVTAIPTNAFEGCSKLTTIKAPEVTSIGARAFSECTSLESVDFPKVTTVGNFAFRGCSNLAGINTLLGTKDVACKVTSIGTGAFAGCGFASMDLRYLDASITALPASLFEGCNKMTSVYFPKQLTEIGARCFKDCTALNSFTLIDRKVVGTSPILTIKTSAFENCSELTTVDLQQANKIENNAFAGCIKLNAIYVRYEEPTTPTAAQKITIDNYAFPLLDKVTIYGYETAVEDYANFRDYTFESLKTSYRVTLVSTNPSNIKVTSDKEKAHKGDIVTVTIKPSGTWDVREIRISGGVEYTDVGDEISEKNNTRVFTFVMPEDDVTVTVEGLDRSKIAGKLVPIFETHNGWPTPTQYSWGYDLGQRGYSTQLRLKDDGEESTELYKWMFTYKSSKPAIATIDEQGVIRALSEGTTTITATLKANKKYTCTFRLDVGYGDRSTINIKKLSVLENATSPKSIHGMPGVPGAPKKYVDANGDAVIIFNNNDVKQAIDNINVEIAAFDVDTNPTDPASKSRNVVSYWSSSDTGIATVGKATSNTNANTIQIKKGAVGEAQIKIYTLNVNEKTPNSRENKAAGGEMVPEDNIRYITIRVQDITPRIANSTVTFNSQYIPGVELPIIPVYGYEIGDDVELEVREYNSKTKTYDYKKGITDVIKVDYDAATGKISMKARDASDREEVNAYGNFTPLYKSIKAGGTVTFSKVAIHGTFSTLLTDGEALTFDIPLTSIKVTNQLPNPTIKTAGSINLFYKGWHKYDGTNLIKVPGSGSASITQTTPKIATEDNNPTVNDYYLVSKDNQIRYGANFVKGTYDDLANNFDIYETTAAKSSFDIIRSQNDLAKDLSNKNVVAGYLYLKYNDYRDPVMKAVTIPTKVTAPTNNIADLSTGTANITANTNARGQKYSLYFYDRADSKNKTAIQLSYPKVGGGYEDLATLSFNEIRTTSGLFNPMTLIKTGGTQGTDYKNSQYDLLELGLRADKTPFKGTAIINLHMKDWEDDNYNIAYTVNLSVNNTKPTVKAAPTTISVNEAYDNQVGKIVLTNNQKDSSIVGLKDYNIRTASGNTFNRVKFVSYSGSALKTQADKEAAALAVINKITNKDSLDTASDIRFKYTHDLDDADDDLPIGTYSFKITPQVKYGGTDTVIDANEIAFTVVVTKTVPSIKLGNATFTVNAKDGVVREKAVTTWTIGNPSKDIGNGVERTTVTGEYKVTMGDCIKANTTTTKEWSSSIGRLTFDDTITSATSKQVTFVNGDSEPKAVTYSYKTVANTTNYVQVNLKDPEGGSDITAKAYIASMPFSIKKNVLAPSVRVTPSGTINLIDANSKITLKSTVTNTTGTVSSVTIAEYDKDGQKLPDVTTGTVTKHFILDNSLASTGVVYIKTRDRHDITEPVEKDPVVGPLTPGKAYTVRLTYKLSNDMSFSYDYPLTIKPTQTFPAVTNTLKKNYMYIGDVGNDGTVVGIARPGATVYGTITVANSGTSMDGLNIDASMSEFVRNGFTLEVATGNTSGQTLDQSKFTYTIVKGDDPYNSTTLYSTPSGTKSIYYYKLTFTGDPKSAISQNKNYAIALTPHYKNQVDKTTAIKTNITVNVRK